MKKRVLIAGVGNIFLQDDGFGPEVIKRLITWPPYDGVDIRDFGTGSLKLAYDLMQGYDALILVDIVKHNGAPGTVYLIEAEAEAVASSEGDDDPIDPHGADPTSVLRLLKSLGAWPPKVLVVGCEPEKTDDFEIGLSAPVTAAIDEAVNLVLRSVEEILNLPQESIDETARHAA